MANHICTKDLPWFLSDDVHVRYALVLYCICNDVLIRIFLQYFILVVPSPVEVCCDGCACGQCGANKVGAYYTVYPHITAL